jgi:hypothetical protein
MFHSEQFQSLTEEEKALLFYSIGQLNPPGFGLEPDLKLVCSYNNQLLLNTLNKSREKMRLCAQPHFSGLMKKLFNTDVQPIVWTCPICSNL